MSHDDRDADDVLREHACDKLRRFLDEPVPAGEGPKGQNWWRGYLAAVKRVRDIMSAALPPPQPNASKPPWES